MKKFLLLLVCFLGNLTLDAQNAVSNVTVTGENILQVTPTTLTADGTNQYIYIEMNNPDIEVNALQFDLVLPEGFTASAPSIYPAGPAAEGTEDAPTNGTRNYYYDSEDELYKPAQTLASSKPTTLAGTTTATTNTLRVLTHSDVNKPFLGTSGQIIRVRVKVATTVAPGLYPIKMWWVEISKSDGYVRYEQWTTSYVRVDSPVAAALNDMDGCLPSFVVSGLNAESSLYSLDLSEATQLNGTLSLTNANAVVYANSALGLSGTNVVVDGNCTQLTLSGDSPFAPASDFTATSATLTRTVGDKYATVVVPFDTQGTFYTLNAAGTDELIFSEVTSLPAGTPALFHGDLSATGSNVNVTPTLVTPDAVSGLTMTGTYTGKTITGGYYLKDNLFYAVNEYATVKPFRAYFSGTVDSSVKAIRIGDLTGVESTLSTATESPEVYDLAGRRLARPVKGVNIVGGDKILVR